MISRSAPLPVIGPPTPEVIIPPEGLQYPTDSVQHSYYLRVILFLNEGPCSFIISRPFDPHVAAKSAS